MRGYNKESLNRVSRKLGSCEKKKDPPIHSNDDMAGLKRRKEKGKGDISAVSYKWNGRAMAVEMKEESFRIDDEKIKV